MKSVNLTDAKGTSLYTKGIHLTINNSKADMELRCNRMFFYPADCQIGTCVGLWKGVKFPKKIGAYSYSHSALETFISIGNYCSIGAGLTIMGGDHPIERFTTSSITYDTVTPLFQKEWFLMRKTFAPPRGLVR